MTEIELLELENQQLREQISQLQLQLKEARVSLKRARDPNPLDRPSFKRVSFLARQACMNLQRVRGGWELSMGHLKRKFSRLLDIWKILTEEDWYLSDLFEIAPKGVGRVALPHVAPDPTFEEPEAHEPQQSSPIPFADPYGGDSHLKTADSPWRVASLWDRREQLPDGKVPFWEPTGRQPTSTDRSSSMCPSGG